MEKEELESYSVSLDKFTVLKAKKIIKWSGGKLSPILNNLLKDWVNNEEKNGVKK